MENGRSVNKTNGLDLSGFVDASYLYAAQNGNNTFGFNQAEVDFEKGIGQIGQLRLDLEMLNEGSDNFSYAAEQGYITLSPPAFGSTSITFGKFNAPIGFEAADPVDMYQHSFGLVSEYCIPGSLTGLMVTTKVKSQYELSFHISNGWDHNIDDNADKTFGGRFCYEKGEYLCVGFSAIRGIESAAEGNNLSVFDMDVNLTPVRPVLIGCELNYGKETGRGNSKEWRGILLMSHCSLNEWLGLTGRFDYLDDKNGSRFETGVAEKRQAATIAPTFEIGYGVRALAEYRLDNSDRAAFEAKHGQAQYSSSSLAFEMTYKF